MKLQLNLPQIEHLQIVVIKDLHFSEVKSNLKKRVSKTKLTIAKLYPQNWFDGVWDDLDYKM